MRIAAAAVALAFAVAACESAPPAFQPGDVGLIVELQDYKLLPNKTSVSAGATRIGIRNRGSQPHDLIVIRTDAAPNGLAYDATSATAREDGAVGKSAVLRPGGSARLDVTLEPGRYVLICNVPGHYVLGMRTALQVD